MLTDLDENRERAHAAREALVGKTIAGRYILRGLLGHGGMGAVYEAEHVGLGKRTAIKFVDPEFATDDKVVARFAREARAMSAIESAHIVTVFDAGTEDGRPYLVMELLRGEDLGQRLRRLTKIPLGEAMHVVAQVLKGLARAHAAGIVHRDLKPDNVFLLKHDTDPTFAKIVDFGVSKIERPSAKTHPLALTGRGTVLGTPLYMAPEQAQASPDVDGRADLYSVGAILFECLTGRPPHTGESYEQIILSICMRDAPAARSVDPTIPVEVSAFLERALARDKTQRFASAEQMLAALHEIAPEERARVPLDTAAPASASGEGSLDATRIDGGSPVSSSRARARASSSADDAVSVATRIGGGAFEIDGAARSERSSRPSDARAEEPSSRPSDARAEEPSSGPRVKSRESGLAAAGTARTAKSKAPVGAAVITAALATLTGVGVTLGVIAMLDKKESAPDPKPAVSVAADANARALAAASASGVASSATIASGAASASASGVASSATPASGAASASASGVASSATIASGAAPGKSAEPPASHVGPAEKGAAAPPSTPSVKTATPMTATSPRASGGAAPPHPTSKKPLDINRDLP